LKPILQIFCKSPISGIIAQTARRWKAAPKSPASAALSEAAVAAGADALIVHHGYFWRAAGDRRSRPPGASCGLVYRRRAGNVRAGHRTRRRCLYISGEISEQTVHAMRESGAAYIAAGHHATERYGVQALGEHLAQRFGLRHRFIDIANPV
jgi:putative NIF3 family GTP cyclohydrolase 1 type 2